MEMTMEMKREQHRLTNLDISTNFQGEKFCFTRKDFTAALTYWLIKQSPYLLPHSLEAAVTAFDAFLGTRFGDDAVLEITYKDLNDLISSDTFEGIPAIEILNHSRSGAGGNIVFVSHFESPEADDDFIDLGALARNVFYMMLREDITQR